MIAEYQTLGKSPEEENQRITVEWLSDELEEFISTISLEEREAMYVMPEWHREILEQRIEEQKENPSRGRPWSEIKKEVRARYEKVTDKERAHRIVARQSDSSTYEEILEALMLDKVVNKESVPFQLGLPKQ